MNEPTKSNFSFSRVWDDTLKMLGANAGLLTAIAGVFLFLPAVLVAHFVPPPAGATEPAEMLEQTIAWWQGNAHWMLLSALVPAVNNGGCSSSQTSSRAVPARIAALRASISASASG